MGELRAVAATRAVPTRLRRRGAWALAGTRLRGAVDAFVGVGDLGAAADLPAANLGAEARVDVGARVRVGAVAAQADRDRSARGRSRCAAGARSGPRAPRRR